MTIESWDTDQATLSNVVDVADDEKLSVDRYGLTDREASWPEPLSVYLKQERPDVGVETGTEDDPWLLVDASERFPGRLVGPDAERRGDGEYSDVVDDVGDYSAEELAMHLVEG